MTRDVDPEVLADIRLRDETLRDRSRGRNVSYSWQPKIIGSWPCRSCTAQVAITEETMERWAMFNTMLRARREQPLDHARIVFCADCVAKHKADRAERNRIEVEELRTLLRKLKESGNPDAEHALLAAIRKARHPDVDGLLESLRRRAVKSKGKAADRQLWSDE